MIVSTLRNRTLNVLLNREKKLNSLTLEMCEGLYSAYASGEKDDQVQAYILQGAGPKAFCAGGDVIKIASASLEEKKRFFKTEYITDYFISQLKKPHISICDGIVMGGGVGIAMHGRFQIATEKTVFAMPETEIGLFPDVGASFLLPRLPGRIGLFLGLTGQRLHGRALKDVGLCSHIIQSSLIEDLVEAICAQNEPSEQGLAKLLAEFEHKSQIAMNKESSQHLIHQNFLQTHSELVDQYFAGDSMEAIMSALSEGAVCPSNAPEAQSFLKTAHEKLKMMSPTSCKLTLEMYKRCGSLSRKQAFEMEYRVMSNLMLLPDFAEGVTKKLVLKDPMGVQWSPNTFEAVSGNLIQSLFEPVKDELVL